jgi:hypothetical protein
MTPVGGRYLTASEIGAFVYCPEAWYLQRTGAERSAAAEQRLDAGVRTHQHIGRQTDHLHALGHRRRWLLIGMALLAALLLLQVLHNQPWMPQP